MAFEIPEIEPTEIMVGDRVQWSRSLADYSATEWTLTYYLRADLPGGQIDITATDDDGDFAVDVATTTTANWTPGSYVWNSFVSKVGYRHYIGRGRIVLKPDFSTLTIPYDGRSHARKTLEAIEAVIEGRATHDQQRYVVQACGRSVDKMPIADLLKFRDYYLTEVKAEDAEAALAAGKATGRNILIRFH